MPKLSQIQPEEIKTVVIPFGGEDLTVTVVASRCTVGWQRKAKEIGDEGDAGASADHFFTVVKDWDLEEEDGSKFPLDASGIDRLGVKTINKLATSIGEALRPNETTSTS